jgi:hypothetical protein
MRPEESQKLIAQMPVPERIRIAKEKTQRVVDHLHYLLELHENNAIVLYSSTLSRQIPTSFAANAFNVFQQGMHQFEIVRLCALWDGVDLEKENVPIVIELIDHADVIEALAEEIVSQHRDVPVYIAPTDDPERDKLIAEAAQRSEEQFGQAQAQKARQDLDKAIKNSRTILASAKHASIMNLRDKHLAHSLSNTRWEKAGPVPQVRYGDERDMLNDTLPIVEALYCWVNGTHLSFEVSRSIDRRNAEALWNKCTFNIQD